MYKESVQFCGSHADAVNVIERRVTMETPITIDDQHSLRHCNHGDDVTANHCTVHLFHII